jgi:4-amino-4-deoxy-L-arabinose transferase-like glycosyltransferase
MNLKSKKNFFLIISAFAVVHILLFFLKGINTGLEAEKYIQQAENVLEGRFPSAPKYYFYVPIIYLIAFAQKFSLGYGFVTMMQSLLSAFALLLFYQGTKKIFNAQTALIASLGLCIFLPFMQWNFFLYSESIFISLSMILFYAACMFEKQSVKFFILIILLLTALVFTRPFGSLFIPPILIYFLFSKYENKKFKLLTVTTATLFVVVMYLGIQAVFHGGEDMDAMKPFIEEHIVCFVPNKPEGAKLDLKYYNNGIADILYYITHNPWHFTKLMIERLFSFFKFTRPWYSTLHNLFLFCVIVPVYVFFIIGLIKFLKRKTNLSIFIIAVLILYPLATTLQCDDWHSRFTMPVLPPIFAVSAYGLHHLFTKVARKIP